MARHFSASTDKIQKTSAGNTATDNYSMFIMVKPTSLSSFFLLTNGYNVGAGAGYGLYVDATLEVHVDISFVADFDSNLRLKKNKWNAIGYVRRSGTHMMFVNGKKGSTLAGSAPFPIGGYYTIGASVNSSGVSSSPAKGGLAHPALWSRGLSDIELIALTKGIIKPYQLPQSLNEYHPLYGKGAVEKPFRNGSDMTVTGTLRYPDPPAPQTSFRKSFQIAKAGAAVIAAAATAPNNYGLNNLSNLNALTLNRILR